MKRTGVQFMADQDRPLTQEEYTLTYSGNVEHGKVTVPARRPCRVTVQIDLTETGQG